MEINIQVPNTSLEEMKIICEEFDLKCKKVKKEVYNITGTDPMNFYWLGANIVEKLQYPNGRKLHEIIKR